MVMLHQETEASPLLCDPYFNIYDCTGKTPAFYSLVISIFTCSAVIVYGGWIYIYRRQHGICALIFRRVDFYWLPVPMESYLVLTCITCLLKLIVYIMVVTDWPESWIIRTTSNGVVWFMSFSVVVLLTAGIIGHIPPVFSQRRNYNYAIITPNLSMNTTTEETASINRDVMDMQSKLLIHVPSIRVIFWTTVTSCALLFVANISATIWFGWAYEHMLMIQYHDVGLQIFCYLLAAVMLFLCIISGYYYAGFYRIIQAYTQRSQPSPITKKEEIAAVCRFRRIFMALMGFLGAAFFAFIIYGIFSGSSQYANVKTKMWLLNIVFLLHHGVLYPLINAVVYYTIHKSSQCAAKRRAIISKCTEDAYLTKTLTRRQSRSLHNENGTNVMSVTKTTGNALEAGVPAFTSPVHDYFQNAFSECRSALYTIGERGVTSNSRAYVGDRADTSIIPAAYVPSPTSVHLPHEEYTPESALRNSVRQSRTLHQFSVTNTRLDTASDVGVETSTYQPIIELVDLCLPEDYTS
ncbi:hypothetical protein BDF22DRAFT_666357 [Syncephalis plumigaleata]|nr:hypothetical protein BDF22DRAFT_666357 [Syncephalis plumigaleata]